MFTGTRFLLQKVNIPAAGFILLIKELQEFSATSRHILELPESICRLDKLKELYFGENDIKALPKSLETMDWLEFAGFPSQSIK